MSVIRRIKNWRERRRSAGARRTIEEFQRQFPGRCPICSYYDFGYTHGYELSSAPRPHANCPEGRGGGA